MAELIDRNDLKIYFGGAIKAIADGVIEGMGVTYTSPEIRDLHKEFFDTTTDHAEKDYKFIDARILYNHGLDKKMDIRNIGRPLKAERSEAGIWLQAQLDMADEYEQMIYEMAQAGKLHWSSGALPQSVIVDENGHIKRWAIIEFSLTPTPAMPVTNRITTAKSLLQPSQLTDSPTVRRDAPVHRGDTGASADIEPPIVNNNPIKGQSKMDNEETQKVDGNPAEVLAGIAEQLMTLAQSMGMSEGDAMAMANEVVEEAKAEGVTPEEDPEEAAEKMVKRLIKKHEANKAKVQKFANRGQALVNDYLKAQPASSHLPAFTGGGNGHEGNGYRPNIQVKSQYSHWTAEDFSFALSLSKMTQAVPQASIKFAADEKVWREFADKATDAHNKGLIRLDNAAIKAIGAIKANELDHSTQTGYGDEWVFTAWADNVWDKPRLNNVVVPLIEQIEMPSNPYEYPVESTDPTVFATAETTAENQLTRADSNSPIPDSKVATAKVQFNAKKHALRVTISAELEEDGIARLMPKFREQAQRAIMDAHDRVVLVGDTSTSGNINLDGGTPTTQAYTSYDGLVHQALVTATTNALDAEAASPTLAHIRSLRALLGNAQGYNPTDLAIITDFPTYMKLLSLNEVLTVDKYGQNATVVTGELGKIDGISVFVSAELALADSDGKITDGGNVANRGRLLMFYRPDWFVGYRRRVAQHVNFLPYADAWELVMTVRHALTARSYSAAGAQQSSDDSVALLYNTAV